MLKLKVNDIDVEIEEGLTVLQACEQAKVEIPRFFYHEKPVSYTHLTLPTILLV